jgi:hypothetical protein
MSASVLTCCTRSPTASASHERGQPLRAAGIAATVASNALTLGPRVSSGKIQRIR